MTDDKLTKLAANAVKAPILLAKHLIGMGLVDKAKMREVFADPDERKKAVVQLKVKGLSNRQIAAALNVSDMTIGRDLAATNVAENATNVEVSEKDILDAAKGIRAEKAKTSRAERVENIAEISKGNAGLNTDRRYPIIYADPPWRYELPPMGGSNRSIENHYPTMTLEEICELPVRALATDDALLYLWATAPKLAECMRVVEAWGFEYRTNFVWVKDKIGMGYHARNQHELLLVCRRGQIPPPAVADRVSSVVRADRADHSEKPAEFYELIESFYPELTKIELFSRQPRMGWAAWGNQVSSA